MSNVLIVDDSAAQRCALERGLVRSQLGIDEIMVSTSATEALERLEAQEFDIVLCTASLPDSEGVDLLEAVAAKCENTATVLLTCLEQGELINDARLRGVQAALKRPFDQATLVDVIEDALRD